MESMLQHAEEANRTMLPFAGRSCDDAMFTLRQQAALIPFVRTISLVEGQTIYCNSLFGTVQWPELGTDYSDGRLRLMPGSQVRGEHPLLALRSGRGERAVATTVDGEYLRFMLAIRDQPCDLLLHVGERWLDERGVLLKAPLSLPRLASHEIGSGLYPLSIYAGYEDSFLWSSLWQDKKVAFLLLLGLSCCAALLIWWLLGRPRSPEGELARALRAREFTPYLQPLVEAKGERLMGAEVLMRWQHPTGGLIRPDLFIPQAEASGLIVPMTHLLMQEVAQTLGAVQGKLPKGFHISFNISAAHCRDMALLGECRDFLAHFAPGQMVLVLELTERELLVADEHTLSLFGRLSEMGGRLAIDDFGTGHSSLLYLQQFQVNYLKIDQSFIRKVGTESLSGHIVDNVIDLGARLGLSLVAEGVETRAQADYLRSKGVDYLQGYLFDRPMPLRQFCDNWCHVDSVVDPLFPHQLSPAD